MNKSGTGFDLPSKKSQRAKLEEKMAKADFWVNQDKAKAVVSELSAVKTIVEPVEEVSRAGQDLVELFELAAQENDLEILASIEDDLSELSKRCDKIEIAGMLAGVDDMDVHAVF